jgi:hypothetical protein
MLKIKTREKCSLPLKSIAKSFLNRGYDIAIINSSDRETLIAHDKKCVAYFYFTEDEDEERKEDLLTDRERVKKVRWINNFINKCIGDYIKNNVPENNTYPYDLFVDKVESFEFTGRPEYLSEVSYFDIRHAYLQIAFKLGYLNKKAYFKLLRLYPEYKLEICAAITTLSKRIDCTYYKKGSSKKVSHMISCDYLGFKEIRNNIIDTSHFLMYKACEVNKINIYLRNVDSVVIRAKDAKKLAKYLDELKVKYKRVDGIYIGNGLIRQADNKIFEAGDTLIEDNESRED